MHISSNYFKLILAVIFGLVLGSVAGLVINRVQADTYLRLSVSRVDGGVVLNNVDSPALVGLVTSYLQIGTGGTSPSNALYVKSGNVRVGGDLSAGNVTFERTIVTVTKKLNESEVSKSGGVYKLSARCDQGAVVGGGCVNYKRTLSGDWIARDSKHIAASYPTNASTWRCAIDFGTVIKNNNKIRTYAICVENLATTAPRGLSPGPEGRTYDDCTGAGGTIVDTNGVPICRLSGSSCPAGWTQYLNWSTTEREIYESDCNYCSTEEHDWSNTDIEYCEYEVEDDEGYCSDSEFETGYAVVDEIGCY